MNPDLERDIRRFNEAHGIAGWSRTKFALFWFAVFIVATAWAWSYGHPRGPEPTVRDASSSEPVVVEAP